MVATVQCWLGKIRRDHMAFSANLDFKSPTLYRLSYMALYISEIHGLKYVCVCKTRGWGIGLTSLIPLFFFLFIGSSKPHWPYIS